MKARRTPGMIGLLVLMAAGILLTQTAWADVFMKQKHHVDGMTVMGRTQPPQDTIRSTWLTKGAARMDHGRISTLFLTDQGIIYHINHANKTYSEISLKGEKAHGMAPPMENKASASVTPTEETRKIGRWMCRKYLQDVDMGMMKVKTELWATEELSIPQDLRASFSSSQMGPGMASDKLLKVMEEEARKIKGVPVLSSSATEMMRGTMVKSSMELLELKHENAPAGTFNLPDGYTKQDMFQGPPGPGGPPPADEPDAVE